MIKIENYEVAGWRHAIRGMRNPMNSWDKSDSKYEHMSITDEGKTTLSYFVLGPNDYKLMMKLSKAGSDHSKFMRMLTVYVDITAPLYWWKEFDTYKVGTVRNSCSTMHKIQEKEFTFGDFSHEHLDPCAIHNLELTMDNLNMYRKLFLDSKDKNMWWQMIQSLPSSYNQKATIMLNYQVLKNMYHARKNHKLDEWLDFCKWVEGLPYSELITG